MRLAQPRRAGGPRGAAKPGDSAAGSKKQLDKLLDALCRGAARTCCATSCSPSQRDVSAQRAAAVLLSVDVAGVDDRLGAQLVKQERAGGGLLRLGVLDIDESAAEAERGLIELSKGATVSSLSRTDVGARVSANRAMQAVGGAAGRRACQPLAEWVDGQLGTGPAEVLT